MTRPSHVTAFAPASVGNTACGFDLLGFAVTGAGDSVTARTHTDQEVVIDRVDGCVSDLPHDPALNTAGRAAQAVLAAAHAPFGVRLSIQKGIPLGSGLGGSAASAVAAALAVNGLLEGPLPHDILYRCALKGEAVASGATHGDNVGPSLYGGFVRADPDQVTSITIPDDLWSVVVHPPVILETRAMRAALPAQYDLATIKAQNDALCALLLGCTQNKDDLIRKGLRDHLAEPVRKEFIPRFDAVMTAAKNEGALGGSIAGAGPSVFVWARGQECAQRAANAMHAAFAMEGVSVFVSCIARTAGARILDDAKMG